MTVGAPGYQTRSDAVRIRLLTAVLGTDLPPGGSWLFLDRAARERIANWPDFAAAAVRTMRTELGRRPHDHNLRDAVQALPVADPGIARWREINTCSLRVSQGSW